MMKLLAMPGREFLFIALVCVALAIEYFVPGMEALLLVVSALGAIPTLIESAKSLWERRIGIDTFNIFAVGVSFVTGEMRSAAFIVLMLAFARLLDWKTSTRTQNAIEELLRLKPTTVFRENKDGTEEEVPIDALRTNDVVIVKPACRVPADGLIVSGEGAMDESSVTGESLPKDVRLGDHVISSTLLLSGFLRVRALHVGSESTLERMVSLMREAVKNKSRPEKLADRFAGIFLPIVIAIAIGAFLWTHSVSMVAAIFLVACADDMAVAIPLAITASLGMAAKRGVIVKGGEWFEKLAKMDTLVLDKTGTLTYGALSVGTIHAAGMSERDVLRFAGAAEKFSAHPLSRAVTRKAHDVLGEVPDPEKFAVVKGKGIDARVEGHAVLIGNPEFLAERGVVMNAELSLIAKRAEEFGEMAFSIAVDGAVVGVVTVSDTPRTEAKTSLVELETLGVKRIIMLTGDHAAVARHMSDALGIKEYHAQVKPEGKLAIVEKLSASGSVVGMVGDGINDAPALARADIGIAMGSAGTAVAVEAADIVIMNDDLSRISEMIVLARRTMSVIQGDGIIWFVSNFFGFALVLTGTIGPALAAFYNFATDFLPLINSSRLFRNRK
jgi:heavy metal translocating P-type ATPase